MSPSKSSPTFECERTNTIEGNAGERKPASAPSGRACNGHIYKLTTLRPRTCERPVYVALLPHRAMTISNRVRSEFLHENQYLIRIPPTTVHEAGTRKKKNGKPWTIDEHNRFLAALERFPSGPWKIIASYVQTRTTRQTMTHAQKYREKIARRNRAFQVDALFVEVDRCQRKVSADEMPDWGIRDAIPNQVVDPHGDALFENSLDTMLCAHLEDFEPLVLSDDERLATR